MVTYKENYRGFNNRKSLAFGQTILSGLLAGGIVGSQTFGNKILKGVCNPKIKMDFYWPDVEDMPQIKNQIFMAIDVN